MIFGCSIGISSIEIIYHCTFKDNEENTWNEMRPNVESFIMNLKTGMKTGGSRMGNWSISGLDMRIILTPFWKLIECYEIVLSLCC